MDFSSIEALIEAGFEGFEPVAHLRDSRFAAVPSAPGVYMILRPSEDAPRFRPESTGGRFKGRNPTVSEVILRLNWVEDAQVLYVGKAGGAGSRNTLRNRISAYIRFGSGSACGHWGGRLIWQLEDSDSLLVCWRRCDDVDAKQYEAWLIQQFVLANGKRPFANLTG